ncbi:hypothetical protein BDZ45DRAFT_683890 [Acephala macrosclerotiorum]|nr:hypothetical protein BDZ45DRAFT_683890 [Acephala macrosclerotiorum]
MTTTACATAETCSFKATTTITSSTTIAAATPTLYVIIPNYDTSRDVITSFTERLKEETNPSPLWVSDAPAANYTSFWMQSLNSTQVEEYKKDPARGAFTSQSSPENGGYTQDPHRPIDVMALSQPPVVHPPTNINTFTHEIESLGENRIYIIDCGWTGSAIFETFGQFSATETISITVVKISQAQRGVFDPPVQFGTDLNELLGAYCPVFLVDVLTMVLNDIKHRVYDARNLKWGHVIVVTPFGNVRRMDAVSMTRILNCDEADIVQYDGLNAGID